MSTSPDVIVLCGGAGLRLRSITGNAPKAMAAIGDRPFLDLLLRKLDLAGFRRVILAIGYQGDAIRSFYGETFEHLSLLYSLELAPLGTGGALRNAADLVTSDAVLVTNGDSYTDVDLDSFMADFREANADVSMVVVPADGRDDCGTVVVGGDNDLMSFNEKNCLEGSRHINAGIYLLSRQMLYDIPPGIQLSIEHELFPRWLSNGVRVRTFVHYGECVDIGTPDRYRQAQELLKYV